MNTKQLLGALGLAAAMAVTAATLACDAAGPNQHIGNVIAIDTRANTFTIVDAQTHRPIRFSATADLVATLRPESNVVVSYEERPDGLKALTLEEM